MSIIVDNISYTYSKKTPFEKNALNSVNLKLKKNKIYLFLGHTGSGKSTLVNLFNALIIPDEGNVIIDNIITSNKKNTPKVLRKKVGLIFQYPESQFFLPTVKEEIEYACKNFNMPLDRNKLIQYLKLLDLNESFLDRSPFNLSGGEMRKIAILSVLSYNPEYLIFDEPTVGLDNNSKKHIFETIQNLNFEGKTIILITHWISDFIKLQPEIFLLKNGTISFQGSFNEFVLLEESFLLETGIIFDDKLKLYKFALENKDEGFIKDLINL